jgi:hypothetical protein
MAILDGKSLRGSIGNLSFSKLGNKNVVRSKPGKGNVKQTEATKKSASVFGTYISPLSKYVRMSFQALLTGFYDGAMVNRMNSDISIILYQSITAQGTFKLEKQSFDRLTGFNFNLVSVLNKSLLIIPETKFTADEIVVSVPEFLVSKGLRFPPKADGCTIEMQVVQFNLEKGLWMVYPPEIIALKKGEQSDKQTFRYPLPTGTLCLVGVRTLYYDQYKIVLNSKAFNPMAIVASGFNPGSCLEEEVKNWHDMTVKMKLEA